MQQKLIADQHRITDGIGVSYLAIDEHTNQDVVIKVLYDKFKQQSIENFLRFRRDISNLSKIKHPDIITIYDTGGDGAACVAQEDIKGGSTLSSRMGNLKDPDTLQISSGLVCAHQQNALAYINKKIRDYIGNGPIMTI
jgi:serine/threonine protein kinase